MPLRTMQRATQDDAECRAGQCGVQRRTMRSAAQGGEVGSADNQRASVGGKSLVGTVIEEDTNLGNLTLWFVNIFYRFT